MRSNPVCPVCSSGFRDKIDTMLQTTPTSRMVLEDIWAECLEEMEELREKADEADAIDKAKYERRRAQYKSLLQLSYAELNHHNQAHRLFDVRQSFRKVKLEGGDVLEGIDFQQAYPHTEMAKGVECLTLRNCCTRNTDWPESTKLENCTGGQISLCSHLNPKLVEKGVLKECRVDCKHVVEKVAEIVIEGRVVVRDVYTYRNLPEA